MLKMKIGIHNPIKVIALVVIFLGNVCGAIYGVDDQEDAQREEWQQALGLEEKDKEGMSLLAQSDEKQMNTLILFEQYYKLANDSFSPDQMKLCSTYNNKKNISFENFQQMSTEGDITATLIVGWMYQGGFGVKKDEKQAFAIFKRIAKQGNADAQFNLGWMYANGRGIPQDFEKAAEWYAKAADQEYAMAQRLGWMYANGRGIPQDFEKAAEWYAKAAAKQKIG